LEPSGPGTEGTLFYRYKLHEADGSDAGEGSLRLPGQAGETIITGAGRRLRVLAVVPVEEEDSPYVGLLQVEST
jgi:hypothetical protein